MDTIRDTEPEPVGDRRHIGSTSRLLAGPAARVDGDHRAIAVTPGLGALVLRRGHDAIRLGGLTPLLTPSLCQRPSASRGHRLELARTAEFQSHLVGGRKVGSEDPEALGHGLLDCTAGAALKGLSPWSEHGCDPPALGVDTALDDDGTSLGHEPPHLD